MQLNFFLSSTECRQGQLYVYLFQNYGGTLWVIDEPKGNVENLPMSLDVRCLAAPRAEEEQEATDALQEAVEGVIPVKVSIRQLIFLCFHLSSI